MTTYITSRTNDRPPEPPFGFGPVRTLTLTDRRLIAQCDSVRTGRDVMRAEWDPVKREWSEWYLEF